jgi:hypothetical protein
MTVLTLTSRFESSWMIKAVRTYLSRSYSTKLAIPESNRGDFTFKWSLRDRILFAMILVLCSVGNLFYVLRKISTHIGDNTRDEFCWAEFMRISWISARNRVSHTHSSCIRRVVQSGSALFPLDCLDGAQMVLLFSGEVVPWSWSIWNDPRLADNELMVQLVRLLLTLFFT